jgi:hypothetical protein
MDRLLSPALAKTIRRVVSALRAARIHYAVIGAVALGVRGHRRFTKDVDLLVDPGKWREARRALAAIGVRHVGGFDDEYLTQLRDRETGAGVDLLFAVGDPEESARMSAKTTSAEGVRGVRVVSAEHLVWLYLLSERAQHEADAIELIKSKRVDLRRLQDLLVMAGVERELLPRLRLWIARARSEAENNRSRPVRRSSGRR